MKHSWGYITNQMYNREHSWFRKNAEYLILGVVAYLLLLGFAWLEYQRVVTNNYLYQCQQENKISNIIFEREVNNSLKLDR
jgi:predicted negative regulator of RcsB-dependent stress response